MSNQDPDPAARGESGSNLLGGRLERTAYRDVLAEGGFRNLVLAMLTSGLGDWIGVLAILALVESILGPTRAAAFALSGVMLARILPALLLGPVAGVYADRWDRKRTLIATDVGRGAIMALLPFATDVFQLFVATFLIELQSTLFIPAKDAAIPTIVDRRRLVYANQLSLMVTYGTLPLGGVLFALLAAAATSVFGGVEFLQQRPAALAIWFNAITFLVSAVFITRVAIPRNGPRGDGAQEAEAGNAWEELKQGLLFIASKPLVRALIVGIMGAFLGAGVVVAVGKLFATILNAGDAGFGVLVAAVGIGVLVGLVASGPTSRRIDKERLFAPGIGIGGGALVVTAVMPRLDLAVIPAFVMGVGAGLAFVIGYTMLQERSTDEIRGRTFAAFNTGVRAVLFASLVVAPLLVGVIGQEQAAPGTPGFYPYQIGGVRLVLVLGGLTALAGAVWTGNQIHRIITERDPFGLEPVGTGQAAVSRGLFVAFEGGEGAGKSTQLRLLRAAVERAGYDVVTTREPGGTALGDRLREMLLDPAGAGLGDRPEALLYAAARAQLTEEVLLPALSKGAVVLCDRYLDSSVVYQGAARGLGEEQVEQLNRWATGGLMPDLVVLLDIDPEEGLRRAGRRPHPGAAAGRVQPDRFEAEGMAFHRAVNAAFRRRAATAPSRYAVLDAARPAEDLHAEIRDLVLERLEQATGPAGAPQPDREGSGG